MSRIFVLVPSLIPTGPIKGAIALCNALINHFEVTLVTLKPLSASPVHINPSVRMVDLGSITTWRARLREYRRILEDAGGRSQAISLSFCLSADVFNFLARWHAVTISSIRGHLPRTYRIDYGPAGPLLAFFHYFIASKLDCVVAMTDRMAHQFAVVTGRRPIIIGNFIDEGQLESFRSPGTTGSAGWRFVFVGRLDPLKSPDLAIKAVCCLAEKGVPCSLDLYGDGPLMARLRSSVKEKDRADIIRFHGYIDNPWLYAADAHCLVLPSLTEGVSRAALEALYLGIPCVMRDVDSNSELIQPGCNGELFGEKRSLTDAMRDAAQLSCRLASRRPVLLGEQFREATCIESYHKLLRQP